MIKLTSKGDFKKTESFLKFLHRKDYLKNVEYICQEGVKELEAATPADSGITAKSWTYEIVEEKGGMNIYWNNSSTVKTGIPIVILLQYGHATRNGGYVQGQDFINPVMKKIFDKISQKVWEEVVKQ